MSERKYTDKQIVKALECCQSHTITDCRDCPNRASGDNCVNELMRNALDLINRQKVEIAVLTTAVDNSTKEFLKLHDEYQDQKADIEKLQEVNADLNESLRLAAEANKDLKAEIEEWEARAKERQGRVKKYLAEIERMEQESNFLAKRFYKEGVKDLAERLKANMCHGYLYLDIEEDLFRRDVDNLVAEMTEGK